MRNMMRIVALALATMVVTPAIQARPAQLSATEEQEKQVKDAVARLKSEGLPAALDNAPVVDDWDKVLVSDAVSVVEIAHVNFDTGTFYLSVQNPWTNVTHWYGHFGL